MTTTTPAPSYLTNPYYLALLETVRTNPWDDAPRLILSDWIEEHDDPERAEFIRVQVELATLVDFGQDASVMVRHYPEPRRSQLERARGLQSREMALMQSHALECLPNGFGYLIGTGSATRSDRFAHVRRGFISEVRLTCAAFMDRGPVCERCGGNGKTPCDMCGGTGQIEHPNGGVNYCPNAYDFDGLYVGHCPDDGECPHCNGTGRLPGLAERLFRDHPITRVVLTDRRPTQNSRHHYWMLVRESGMTNAPRDELPTCLFDELPLTSNLPYHVFGRPGDWRSWVSEESALAALSDACVAYGRSLVGLPPLAAKS